MPSAARDDSDVLRRSSPSTHRQSAPMKIILIGASGTIGKAVDAALGDRHEVVRVNRSGGDFRLDMADPN